MAYALEERVRSLEERLTALETAVGFEVLEPQEEAELKKRIKNPDFVPFDEFWRDFDESDNTQDGD